MKIGVFLHPYGEQHPAGLARAILDWTGALLDLDRKNEYLVFAKESSAPRPQFAGKNWDFFTGGGGRMWMDNLLKKHPGLDICVFNTPVLPLRRPKKSVVIALDFAYKYLPASGPAEFLKRTITGFYHGYSLKRADAVVAISQATKEDAIKFFHIPANKVQVVYLGFQNICAIPESPVDTKGKFFLFAGAIKERKNVFGVIRAFYEFARENPDYRLVVTGYGAGKYFGMISRYIKDQNLEDKIVFLSHCSDAELSFLYKRAEALVFPSFIEGFGFPVLEAMACGLAVITSKTSSLGEIAGDAATLVDPENISEIKDAMKKIISDGGLQKELIRRGFERIKNFSWEKAAEELLAIMKKTEESR